MAAPIRFLSGRQQQQKIGIEGSTENEKVLEVVGRVGIGTTIFEPGKELEVRGGAEVTGILTANCIKVTGAGNTFTDLETQTLNVSGVSTFVGLATFTTGDVHIAQRLFVGGIEVEGSGSENTFTGINTFTNLTDNTLGNTNTGSLQGNGGLGIDKNASFGSTVFVQNAIGINSTAPIGKLDVNGHTELDNVNVSGLSTFTGLIDANGGIDVNGRSELDNINVSGLSTFVGVATFTTNNVYIDQKLFVGGVEVSATGSGSFTGINTFTGTTDNTLGNSNTGTVQIDGGLGVDKKASFGSTVFVQNAIGIGSTTPIGKLDVNGHTELDNLNVSGVSTFTGNISANGNIVGDNATSISGINSVTATSFVGNLTGIATYTSEWILESGDGTNYGISGPGLSGTENDPTLYLVRGEKYKFTNDTGGHPFRIQSTPNGSAGTAYNDGVTNNNAGDGTTLLWDVQFDAPNVLYYQCTTGGHGAMGGKIYIGNSGDSINVGTAATISSDEILFAGISTFRSTAVIAGNNELHFKDSNAQIKRTGGDDLEISVGGSNDLSIKANNTTLFVKNGTHTAIDLNQSGSVELYYNNGKKFETTSIGATVYGRLDGTNINLIGVSTFKNDVQFHNAAGVTTVFFDQSDASFKFSDSAKLKFGNSGDMTIKHDGTDNHITSSYDKDLNIEVSPDGGTPKLYLRPTTSHQGITLGGGNGNPVELYHTNAKKFETIGTGVSIANGASDIATIAGPATLIIDPMPVGVGTTSGIVRIKGDLYVDGTTTTINSTTVEIADKVIGVGTTCNTDLLTDGAGIGIGSDKTFLYEHNSGTNPSLKASENLNVPTGKGYQVNQVEVLNYTTLGSNVVNSSLTNLGTLTALDVNGHTELDNVNVTGLSTFKNDVQFHNTAGVTTVLFDKSDASFIFSDSAKLKFGNSADVNILSIGNTIQQYSSSSKTWEYWNRGGKIKFGYGSLSYGNNRLVIDTSAGVELYYGDSSSSTKKLETTGYGVTVTGDLQVSGISTFHSNAFVGSGITMYAATGIISATQIWADGSNLTGLVNQKIDGVSIFNDTTQVGSDFQFSTLKLDGSLISAVGVGSTATISIDTTPAFDTVSVASSILHTGDSGTYIGFPANDTFVVDTSSSERLRVTSGGDVGIGTTTPTTKLDVVGGLKVTGGIATLTGTDIHVHSPHILSQSLFIAEGVSGGVSRLDTDANLSWDTSNTRLNTQSLKIAQHILAGVKAGAGGTTGRNGQVLQSTGAGVTWAYAGGITSTTSLTGTSQTPIYSGTSISMYRSVEYTIQITQGTNYQFTKLAAIHDGTDTFNTEWATIFNTASAIASFDTDINGGNLRLLATNASSSQTNYSVKILETEI